MADADWYRRTTWTSEEQQAFFQRLLQSRSTFHKAQYTRIQASCLQQVGTPELLEAALGLYEFVLREYPHETSQLLAAHVGRTECLADLLRPDEALRATREALEFYRLHPTWYAPSLLTLGRIAVRDRLTEIYPPLYEALFQLTHQRVLQLPQDLYTATYVLALMADHFGEHERARLFAQMALRYAAATDSPLRRYPQLGLVRQPSQVIQERLHQIVFRPEAPGDA